MGGSSQEGEGKKKVTEVKIFDVPFNLEDIKENIIITTNALSKPSKEQLINQAFKFHSRGNISEAAKYYQDFINQGFNDHRVFSNYGVILRDLGKLKEAELTQLKAIEINPDFADAHLNLGNILRDLGKLQESFASYLRVIKINPTYPNIYCFITEFLRDSDPSQLDKSDLKKILLLLLERNDVPHKELNRVFNFIYSNEIISNLKKSNSDLSVIEILVNNKVIINALKKITFKDIRLEKLLTNIRKYICERITENKEEIGYSQLQFIIALGEQCFLNEYVYSFTKEENISANIIIQRCRDSKINEINISILSCYFPLYKLLDQIPSLKSFNSSNQSFRALIELQITEPLKEIKLSENIKKLGSINDEISQKVQSQYEENPYPRWRYGRHHESRKISISKAINIEIKPNSISSNIRDSQLQVLIAGCGTGNQILHSQRYNNSQITGIDLSLSSLAYAQRKINELGIDNVELIQMDILEVSLLEEQFDIIESSGVLHHMNDPSKGLKALLGVLKDDGFLKLGLYSELARQDIIKARNYIASKNLKPTTTNIRQFRKDVIAGTYPEIDNLQQRSSFYSISECRDLCFHEQEHRFTINQLQETLQSNKLKFLGFLLQPPVKSLYKKYYPEDKQQINLQNWARFEEKHPHTFRGMYQFWVSKTEN
ncbi:methyltransferase domain-containing protein [Prochlorococcus sp. MIT 0916]|uniref:Translation elongation factor P n=1 Tax=Prochlorococcus marinus str. P0903-H212 TaxID=1622208 RepID=A0A0D5A4A6_PROMR|nr:Translation elongation factor P [Prochlorococcus marinus str. P0903-H212]